MRKGKYQVVRTTRKGKVVESTHAKKSTAIRLAKSSVPSNKPFTIITAKENGGIKKVATVTYLKATPLKKKRKAKKRSVKTSGKRK